jgi:predicted membrane-bound spermidine synthase
MEGTTFFDDEAREKERNRYFLAFFLKLVWTSLTLGALLGLLTLLTIILRWSAFILPCMLGFLAGISLTIGVSTSLQNRARISRLLGVLTLPGLAVYLSFMAGSSPQAYEASSSALMPFVIYSLAALIGGLIILKIWKNMPIRERNKDKEKEPVSVLTPAKKEHTSHEGSDLDKAA